MEKLLQKIMLKAYEVNKNTKHTVCVYFYGHVNQIEIYIYLNGWIADKDEDIKRDVYLDERTDNKELQEILEKLEGLEMKENV